ncbi:MAG: hypothetical protein ACLFQK_04380 [Fibrobacterota bacterium]
MSTYLRAAARCYAISAMVIPDARCRYAMFYIGTFIAFVIKYQYLETVEVFSTARYQIQEILL